MSIVRKLSRKLHGPRCHVSPDEKGWVERRMLWLNQQFGPEPIRRTPLDPTSDLLPKKWDASYDSGADLFNRLCAFMLVDPATLHLHFYSKTDSHATGSDHAGESHSSGPAGLYVHSPTEEKELRKRVIALAEEGLRFPARLAATICHELAHALLLGDGRLKADEKDGEHLTDLLTVYFGAGVLTANAAFQFSQWQSATHHGWNASRQGYLSEQLYGYGLACFSWYRGDRDAKWRKHLRENIEYYFSDSMHFLATTSDTKLPFNGA
jgi:hypothetical protein